jgi:hypothetical protein
MPHGCISLPVTFGTAESYHMESVLFDVAEVSLPSNAILGRPALYQFMVVAHYGYLVLKMSSPNGVLKIRGDRDTGACALEKLQAMAAAHEAAAEPEDQDPVTPSTRQRGSASASRVQLSAKEDVPVKTVQIRAEAGQITVSRVIWTANRNSCSSPSSGLMSTCLPGNHHKCLGSLGR